MMYPYSYSDTSDEYSSYASDYSGYPDYSTSEAAPYQSQQFFGPGFGGGFGWGFRPWFGFGFPFWGFRPGFGFGFPFWRRRWWF